MHRVVVLALPGVVPFELGIPARIFGAARDQLGDNLVALLRLLVSRVGEGAGSGIGR
jgi:hypothetical protein